MVPEPRLQQLIASKDIRRAQKWCDDSGYSEGWALVDGCLVIYDINDSPLWLTDQLIQRDEYGNTPAFYDPQLREDLEQREDVALSTGNPKEG